MACRPENNPYRPKWREEQLAGLVRGVEALCRDTLQEIEAQLHNTFASRMNESFYKLMNQHEADKEYYKEQVGAQAKNATN